MKCKENPEKLISLIYDEINEDEKKRLLEHIESCESCKKSYKELTSTKNILNKWEDRDPEMNLVFAQKPESWWKKISDNMKTLSMPKKLAFTVPATVVCLFLLLSIFNFQAQKINGNWNISLSLFPQKHISDTTINSAVQKALKHSQQETIQLVSELLEESQYQQKVEFTQTLNNYSEQLQSQRLNDLRLFYQDLAGLYQETENNFSQTRNVLSDLVEYTSLQIERK